MAILMLLLGMAMALAIVVFALQNGRIVTVSFFDWSVEGSLVLVIMASALMGFLRALVFELFIQIKLRFRLYKMGRHVRALEEELVKWQKSAPKESLQPDEGAAKKTDALELRTPNN